MDRLVSRRRRLAWVLEVTFVDRAVSARREPLPRCRGVEYERVRPARGLASVPGQSHFPGMWWFSLAGVRVGFESWPERDVVMWLDAGPDVTRRPRRPRAPRLGHGPVFP